MAGPHPTRVRACRVSRNPCGLGSHCTSGIGTSAWWFNHADPHIAVLLSVDGPFAGSQDETEPGNPLPYLRPPAMLFPPDKQPPGIYDDTVYSRQ
jgi:hypothetical protein